MSTLDQETPDSKDDPIPEEVHRRAEALAQEVLKTPPRPQRKLTKGSGESG